MIQPQVTVQQADQEAADGFATRALYPPAAGVKAMLATAFARHRLEARKAALEEAAEIAAESRCHVDPDDDAADVLAACNVRSIGIATAIRELMDKEG